LNRNSLLLFVLVSVAAGLSWWLAEFTTPEPAAPKRSEEFPDAYAKQLTVLNYNDRGEVHYRLKAPTMQHYEKDDTTELDQPRVWQFNDDNPPWVVQGEAAIMTGDKDSLFMAGKVTIERAGTPVITPYHIATRDLTLNTVTSYAETEQPIRIESQDHWIDGVGMQGWLQDPVRIKLLNKVTGYYEIQ
jgi:lipopolysaccharide export system protein LptC